MRRLIAAIIVITAGTLAVSSPLWAKGEYDDRIAGVERQISSMQNTSSFNNQEVASALARMGAFQDEFVGIKGQVEAASHLIRAQGDDLSKRVAELDHRIQAIEDRLEIFSNQLTKALGKVAPQAAAEGELYQKGLDLASSSQYLEAAAAFESFLKQYPQSTFSPDAKLWIAECFYSIGDYRRAIKEYQAFIEKYPRSDKAADAILKQGNSFYQLGMLEEATAFYQKVVSTYPRSAAASQAQDRLARVQKRQAGGQPAAQGGGGTAYPTETLSQQLQRQTAPQAPAPNAAGAAPAPGAKPKPVPRTPGRDF